MYNIRQIKKARENLFPVNSYETATQLLNELKPISHKLEIIDNLGALIMCYDSTNPNATVTPEAYFSSDPMLE